ncbi:hypothetical protein CL616_01170 [archaeon]|nr:hypothetical protein [archaeon]|tara:strand:- start:527 stop:838 length:312 start_codon:yes stop_codon:yes gene_type:complete
MGIMATYLVKDIVEKKVKAFGDDDVGAVAGHLINLGFRSEGSLNYWKNEEYVGMGDREQIHLGEGISRVVQEEVIKLSGAKFYKTDKDHGRRVHLVRELLSLF